MSKQNNPTFVKKKNHNGICQKNIGDPICVSGTRLTYRLKKIMFILLCVNYSNVIDIWLDVLLYDGL